MTFRPLEWLTGGLKFLSLKHVLLHFVMKGLQKLLGIGAVALGLTGLIGKADAGVVNIAAKTSDTAHVGVSPYLSLRTDGSTSSSFDSSFDTKNPSLEISSNDPGYRASIVGAPQYTNQFTFDLAIGPNPDSKITTGPLNEILNFQIPDNTDLSGKTVIAYNLANPSVRYTIPQDNSKYTVTLNNYIPNNQSGFFDHWRLDVITSHTLQIDFYKNTGTAGSPVWVRSDQNTPGGVGPVKVTYTNDPLVKEARDPKGTANPTGDPFDKWVKQQTDGTTGWQHVFNNTTLGEFGAYTRQAAFGFNGTDSTNDRMQEEGRPLDSKTNILIETYRNSSITTPVYSENDSAGKWKMTFTTSTADIDFFKDFRIIQNEPYDFWADPRYDSRKVNPAPMLSGKALSSPETYQEAPYATLENLLNSEAGLLYTTQGCLMGDGSTEIDSVVGPIGAFDIFPSGGTDEPYNYFVTGNETFFIEGEGNYSIWHTTTPEPSTISLLAMAGIAGAGVGAYALRKSRKGTSLNGT